LNQRLKTVFRDLGYSWTEDIAPLGSSGANRYLSPSDYEIFRKEFEQLFGIFQQWGKSPIRLTIDWPAFEFGSYLRSSLDWKTYAQRFSLKKYAKALTSLTATQYCANLKIRIY